MTKLVILIVVILVAVTGFVLLRDTAEEVEIENLPQPVGADSPLNATYEVEEQTITMASGTSEIAQPDSVATIVTEVFGEPVVGDIDGDGDTDAALWFVQDSGGTGRFYYAAAAINVNRGYTGTNAIYLGDRIAPQTLEIRNGQIIANYADRKPNEPMAAQPSVGVSKYLELESGKLVEADAPASTGGTLDARTKFAGIVRTGASQGEVKKHCANGLYLELDPGLQLNARVTLLLLRDSAKAMITDSNYINKRVTVTGEYPQENAIRCEALICNCEEYLLAESIVIE